MSDDNEMIRWAGEELRRLPGDCFRIHRTLTQSGLFIFLCKVVMLAVGSLTAPLEALFHRRISSRYFSIPRFVLSLIPLWTLSVWQWEAWQDGRVVLFASNIHAEVGLPLGTLPVLFPIWAGLFVLMYVRARVEFSRHTKWGLEHDPQYLIEGDSYGQPAYCWRKSPGSLVMCMFEPLAVFVMAWYLRDADRWLAEYLAVTGIVFAAKNCAASARRFVYDRAVVDSMANAVDRSQVPSKHGNHGLRSHRVRRVRGVSIAKSQPKPPRTTRKKS